MEGVCILLLYDLEILGKSDEERVEQLIKRVEADDSGILPVYVFDGI